MLKHEGVITETIKMISKEEMGARANQKLIEMKHKEDFNKPVMKTKVTLAGAKRKKRK